MNKSYSELLSIPTFKERFEYLRLSGNVGDATFGFDRYINQYFYTSAPWRSVRNRVIVRDNGCDLAMPERYASRIHVHHINPVTLEMLDTNDPRLFDMDNLICVDSDTHRAIHYGGELPFEEDYVPRSPGDTKLW